MNAFTQLRQLARETSGDPETALRQALTLVCELLGMDTAMVGPVHGGLRTVDRAVGLDGQRVPALETTFPAEDTFCAQVDAGASLVVTDASAHQEGRLAHRTTGPDVCSYIGIALDGVPRVEEGSLVVLGLVGTVPRPLDAWDTTVLEALVPVITARYAAVLRPAPDGLDAPEVGPVDAEELAVMARPLLDALHEMSGIATTFLTRVDQDHDAQKVLLVHRTDDALPIPEGATIEWSSSMCRYAHDEGRPAVTDLPTRWPGATVGVAMGVLTHVSVPVELSDGDLWGTLCASDVVVRESAADHVSTLRLFARLIAAEVERAAALTAERVAAAETHRRALTDELTGASARRTVQPWLGAALEHVGSDDRVVLAFVDVDRFKAVNDTRGHAVGDTVLVELVARLHASARSGDLVARLGGDEFVVAARLPRPALADFEDRVRAACAFDLALPGAAPVRVRCSIGFVTSDEAGEADMLAAADARMYRHKTRRAHAGGVLGGSAHDERAALAPTP